MLLNTGRCAVCGEPSPGSFIPCDRCRCLMEYRASGKCRRCGIDLAGARELCTACRDSPDHSALAAVETLGEWRGPLREWLSIYKYGGDARMAGYLADRLAELLRRRWPDVPIVPVPPRALRMKKEGFDPVGYLARYLKKDGFRVLRILRRLGRATQKGRNRNERLRAGALDYRLKRFAGNLEGSYVLLDDVTTTGATLEVCASVLIEAGADRVYAVAVCRD